MLNQLASNDSFYFSRQNKNLPIITSLTCVPGYPIKLKIYLIHASPYWQVRCYHNGKIFTRSTKTADKKTAITFARRFYEELCARNFIKRFDNVIENNNRRYQFNIVAEKSILAEIKKSKYTKPNSHSFVVLRNRIHKKIIPYFTNKHIAKITQDEVDIFIEKVSQECSALSLKHYIAALRKIFIYAQQNNLIKTLPLLPKMNVKSTPRGSFSVNEYLKLLRTAKNLSKINDIKKHPTHRNTANGIFTATDSIPTEITWLIGFMVNSFIRPVDAKLIQHKHIEIITGKNNYLRLTLPETKGHRSQIVTLQPAVRIYSTLKKYMAAMDMDKPDDYLFLPNIHDRRSAMILLTGYFNKCLITANLKIGNLNQNRTLYSLRHTAIMFRLLYGKNIDLLTLARNARTSVRMIEEFYASNLTAEMNIDLIQSRR